MSAWLGGEQGLPERSRGVSSPCPASSPSNHLLSYRQPPPTQTHIWITSPPTQGQDAYTPSCVKEVTYEAQSRPGRGKLPPNPPPSSWGPSLLAFKRLLGSWVAAAASQQSRMVGQGSGGASVKCPTQCFDELIRRCLPCNLYQTPMATGADNISSSSETVTVMTQVSNTSMTSLLRVFPGPYLLLGIPIGLGIVLALLYGLLVCLLQRRLERTPDDEEAGPSRELAQGVDLPLHQEPKALQTQNSNLGEDQDQHPFQECDGAPEPASAPSHSFPVPATELGAMELVTTKTITTEL
ncbi:tumor necrosis factor receptor superfamily member 13C [Petaurus breviceps papuanus]|uniref:tumor necrosis factor receptor superfamily member 13C n=1 Tax=Petaurus breviceps papuanus TaxID=3040969 RepID=UPI0036D7E951